MTKHPFLLLLLLSAPLPAAADVWPQPAIPDPGRQRGPLVLSSAMPSAPRSIPWGGGPTRVDATGARYTPKDVALGFLPVPSGYRRSGGGLVRVWNGAPKGFTVPGVDTPLPNPLPPTPPTSTPTPTPTPQPPDQPAPPTPIDPPVDPQPDPDDPKPIEDVPGPLGLLAIAAGFHASRRLRQQLQSHRFPLQ
jgi:hypothetical protein